MSDSVRFYITEVSPESRTGAPRIARIATGRRARRAAKGGAW